MNLAHYALQKLHILPSTLAKMSDREKAFIYTSINTGLTQMAMLLPVGRR